MTGPEPPTSALSEADALTFYKTLRDAADASLLRAHLIWALVLAGVLGLVGLAAFRAYEWKASSDAKNAVALHTAQVARAAADARADSANARADRWAHRSEALADSVRIDTQLVTRIIEAAPKPVLVPVTAENGTTSIVPMIPAVTFDSTAARCTRLAHDCTAALAAKDSTITAKDSAMAQRNRALAAADSMVAVRTRQVSAAARASFFARLGWGAGGLLIGRASCSVH